MQLQNSSSKPSDVLTETDSETTAIATIQTWLVNQLAKQLSISAQTIKVDEPLTRYGLDSIDSVTIVGDMEDWLETDLPSTLLWDYPTIAKAAEHLVKQLEVNPTDVDVEAAPEPEKASAGKGWGGLFGRK